MEEPARLVCPQCHVAYRLKRWTPGKTYHCKNCGGVLSGGDDDGMWYDAPPRAVGRYGMAGGASDANLERLSKLLDDLDDRLETFGRPGSADGMAGSRNSVLDAADRLEGGLRSLDEDLGRKIAEVDRKLGDDSLLVELRDFQHDLKARLAGLERRVEAAYSVEGVGRFPPELQAKLARLDGKLDAVLEKTGDFGELVAAADPGDDVRRLPAEVKKRLADVDAKLGSVLEKAGELGQRLAAAAQGDDVRQLAADLKAQLSQVDTRLVSMLGKTADAETLDALRRELKEGRGGLLDEFLSRLEVHRERQKEEVGLLLNAVREGPTNTTIEVDIDALAKRLADSVRVHSPFFDTGSGTIIDAVAKLADELVKEQKSNTGQVDRLATEIRNAVAGMAMLEEWRGGLPERVADEIGQNVEERVVGPISHALARQAPAILSELQDSKLVDIVSRSVREAQRPLLREILAGGRSGVSGWWILAVLIPVLFFLGYLFFPGEFTINDIAASQQEISDRLARIEASGVPVSPETEERLVETQAAIADMRSKALEHAENSGRLLEQVNGLQAQLKEKDQVILQYEEMVKTQTRKMRQYEMKLVQLGVQPASVAE